MDTTNQETKNQETKAVWPLVVGGVLVVTVLAGVTYGVVRYYRNTVVTQKTPSPVELLKRKPEVAALINQQARANSKEVFTAFDELSKKEADKNQAESLKLYAASSLIGIDRKAGADYYVKIAKDLNNEPIVRAYAMTQLSQYAIGDANLSLLTAFFDDPTVVKKMTSDEIKLAINKKILEVYPMPLALANTARLELKKEPTKEKAQLLRDLYSARIEQGLASFNEVEGLSHFSSVTYLVMAAFLEQSEVVGVGTTTEVREYYDKAFAASLAANQVSTKQFVMLHYADYLISRKLNADAEMVISSFVQENLTETFVTNFKGTKGIDYPSILKYMSTSQSKTAKDLSRKIGAFLK